MISNETWYTGIDNFRKCTLSPGEFTTTMIESDFEPDREIDIILKDNIEKSCPGTMELLYSGGVDSEFVLKTCLKYNIKVEAITMMIYADDVLINTHDIYYTDKFYRENDIKHRYVKFDATEFYESGQYLNYLAPYKITDPHVASHFWLIDQCSNFPVLGGDWNWVQTENKRLSPSRLSYNCYEKYMHSKNISGVGNIISHSFEAAYRLMQLHIKHQTHNISHLKVKMYGMDHARLRSYGWERIPPGIFNINKYKIELVKKLGMLVQKIEWGEKVSSLLGSTSRENTKF